MTNSALFAPALGHLFATLGVSGWLTRMSGPHEAVKVIMTTPDRNDLLSEAAMSLANRYLDLAATVGAGTGDLITLVGATYSLARSPDPDELGLASRWIGVPLSLSVGSIVYHADGHPLVEFNGIEWVQEGQL